MSHKNKAYKSVNFTVKGIVLKNNLDEVADLSHRSILYSTLMIQNSVAIIGRNLRPTSIYQNSCSAARLRGIKQMKSS